MKDILNEEWLRQVLEAARNCRMRQLEPELMAWAEYREVEKVKNDMITQLEGHLQQAQKEMLSLYDDASSLLLGRTQDFFYEQGFADCLRILCWILVQYLLDMGRERKQP